MGLNGRGSIPRCAICATGTSMSAPSPSVSKITVKSQKPKEVKARRARLLKNPDCVALIKEAVAAANGGGECADCKERAAELIVELRENARLRGELSQAFIDQRKLMLEKSEATTEHTETMRMLNNNYKVPSVCRLPVWERAAGCHTGGFVNFFH